MPLVRCLRQRKILLWIFSVNTICFGIILLVLLDRKAAPSTNYQIRAFEKWKQQRDRVFALQEGHDLKMQLSNDFIGRQMDRVIGLSGDSRNNSISDKQRKQVEEERRIDAAMQSADKPLNYIPIVPEYSVIDVVPFLNESITYQYLNIPKRDYNYKIVILTPVCDVAHLIKGYALELSKLDYPHELISVYFGEDSSSDRTFDMARIMAYDLRTKYGFSDARAFHLNTTGGVHGTWVDVHDKSSQFERRSHLAKARNLLLKKSLSIGNFDYVLWIDSDVKTLSKDLIQQLLYAKSDVVAPSCLFEQGRHKKVFDKNSWRETPTSISDQRRLPDDVLIVEGYSHTYRIYLADLKPEGRVVSLDGVGGCVLLVKGSCHRKGLTFPEKVYSHHIETEGLAKLATDMGYSVKGMPWVEILHN